MDELVRSYRRLLVKPASPGSVKQCLKHTIRVFNGWRSEHQGVPLPDWSAHQHAFFGLKRRPVPEADALELDAWLSPALKADWDTLAKGTSEALVRFPVMAEYVDPPMERRWYALLMDACLLLFHHSYFGLVPKLGQRHAASRDLLLESYHFFARHLPLASDQYRVLGHYFEANGDLERAGEAYSNALSATHSDAHEFMTLLQKYWAFLLDRKQFKEALTLLLSSYPRVTRVDIEEMNELILMTFDLSSQHVSTAA